MTLTAQSRRTIMSSVFVACTSFSITLPSLWPYLVTMQATPAFLALVVAIYSVGEAAGALGLGALTKTTSMRNVALLGNLVAVIGSLLYVAPPALRNMPGLARWLIFCARFLQGIWTGGAQAYQQAYFAAVLPQREIMEAIIAQNAYASAGFLFGPAIGFALSFLPEVRLAAGLTFSQLTGPGYFMLLAALYTVYIYIYHFDEEADRAPSLDRVEDEQHENIGSNVQDEREPLLPPPADAKMTAPSLVQLMPLLVFYNIAFFIHFLSFALQETVTTPLVQRLYDWSVRDATVLFTLGGIATVGTFVAIFHLSAFCSDRVFLLFSFVVGLLGNSLLMPWSATYPGLSQTRFIVGFGLLSVAFPVGRASIVTLNTKLLPMHVQGVGQGAILAVGALARIVGPFFVVPAVHSLAGQAIVYGSVAALFLPCFVATVLLYRHLEL